MAAGADIDLGHFCLTAASPDERFAAAARAGFAGISLFWGEVRLEREGAGGLAAFRRRLTAAGLRPALTEYIPLPTDEAMAGFAGEAKEIAEASAELGCALVQAVALRPGMPYATVREGLEMLVEAARAAGLRCALEFVPFISSVPDLGGALRLLRDIDSPALGMLVDSFHFFRSGAPWAQLEGLRPGQVLCIQVNDGPIERPGDDYGYECMALRRLPGDGEFDLARFVRVLAAVAPGVPLMAEVVNSELLAAPAAAAARTIGERMRELQRTAAATPRPA